MIYYKEVCKIDCTYFGYIVIQNEWTGQTRGRLYTLHLDGNYHYCNCEGHRVPMEEEYKRYRMHEDDINIALDWYRKTKF